MLDAVFSNDRDALLAAVPLIGALLLGFFRLDTLLAAPSRLRASDSASDRPASGRPASRRPPSGIDQDGQPILCDPDGRRQPLRR
jgi:hypothetical protein